jgi:hypothetical protein
MLRNFAGTACDWMRLPGGGYRCDYLRALARRVYEGEGRVMGPKNDLPRTRAGSADECPALFRSGGETGIRTLGRRKPTTVFETAAFDHSATSPRFRGRPCRAM